MCVAHLPRNLAVYYHKNLCLDGSDKEVTSKKREHDKRNKHVGNMYVEELIAWTEEEAKSSYLRSPPLQSRPFRNDMKDLMDLLGDVVFRIHYNGMFVYDPLRYK
uniref:Pyruvate kinase n=1 Tax=Tanacetum cinerariifolium TaxID=118510 RepID=A0A699SNF5_TANCI|nr:pyruvate kinase [Tanacetum cinerariifolium]